MQVGGQPIHRYERVYVIVSMLDPVRDVLTLVQSLVSKDYLIDTLVRHHSLPTNTAKSRAKTITPHIETAIRYIEQSFAGPQEVAFLPTYYALLDLAKAYVLLGPRHADLAANRTHGISYRVDAKDSQTLLTEQVTLRTAGAFPLFYETLTGVAFSKTVRIKLAEVYPFISDIGAEYELASRRNPQLVPFHINFLPAGTGSFTPVAEVYPQQPGPPFKLRQLKLLKGFKLRPNEPNRFTGPNVPSKDSGQLRASVRPFLIYHNPEVYRTPICTRRLLLPEEVPILIAFFHMSSVVRYKPEFLAKLRDSRYWPMLAAMERHCLFKFLHLFWSFAHQTTLHVRHGSA